MPISRDRIVRNLLKEHVSAAPQISRTEVKIFAEQLMYLWVYRPVSQTTGSVEKVAFSTDSVVFVTGKFCGASNVAQFRTNRCRTPSTEKRPSY